MRLFGTGLLWGIPLQDASGNAIINPTPQQFGILQDVSTDISFDTKLLYGQNQFALDAARGKGKISLKAKFAEINGQVFNALFLGQSTTNSIVADYFDIIGTAAAATVTPTVPSAGTWTTDLGVRNTLGITMVRVASAPTTGQYSVAAGVYTFATADFGVLMYISFQYTGTSTTAKKGVMSNLLMGAAPTFRCDLSVPRGIKSCIFTFNSCISSKFTLSTKQDDFIIPEMDFDAFADANGNVMTWAMSE